MQCPLCRESVADDNALQVHYLMSCLGYLKNPTSNKSNEALPTRSSKKLVQFRWIKSKPTLAREVYLISSLAGSVKLEWHNIEECFLSDQVEVPQGLHLCQLVVDGDAMSTDDFNVSDTSRTIDVLVPEASLVEGSTGNLSEDETHEPQPTSPGDHENDQDETESDVQTRDLPPKSSLYHELIKHQILHGDSLENSTDNSRAELGGSSGYRRERGNGLAVGNSQHQRSRNSQDSGIDQPLTRTTGVRTGGDHDTARPSYDISHLPSVRQRNDDLRDSMNSDDLQQFLQPARARQESEASGGRDENEIGTTEERESSLSDNEEHSVSVSSHEDFERRPELLGQSNGESNEPRVQPDSAHRDRSDYVQDVDGEESREQSSGDHRQETLLIDLREASSGHDREDTSSARRVISGNDRARLLDDHHEQSSGSDPRKSSGDNGNGTSNGREQPSINGRGFSGEHRESLSSARRKHLSSDGERTSKNVHEKFSGSHSDGFLAETSGGHQKQSSRYRRKKSPVDNRERSSGSNRKVTSDVRHDGTVRDLRNDTSTGLRDVESETDRSITSGSRRETKDTSREPSGVLRTEISGDLRQEMSNSLQEKTSADDRLETSNDRRETSEGGREGEVASTGRETILESPTRDDTYIFDETTSPVITPSYTSLPTTLSSGITQDTQTEDLINSHRTADTRVAQQEHQSLLDTEGISTGGLIFAQGSATSLTGSRGLEDETRRGLNSHSSAASYTRNRSLEAGTAKTTTTATDDLLFRSYSSRDGGAPIRDSSALSTDRDSPSGETNAASRDGIAPSRDMGVPSRDMGVPSRDMGVPSGNASTPTRGGDSPSRNTSAPSWDTSARSRNESVPSKEASVPSREVSAPSRDASGPSGEVSAPSRDMGAPSGDTSALSRDAIAPSRNESVPSVDASAPSREESGPSRNGSAASREKGTLNRGEIAPSRSRNRQHVSDFSGGDNCPPYTRRSPQGSFLDDGDIRRPPLYTSVPSRPYSSLPYTPHTAISPLTSPRDDEVAASSSDRHRLNADTISHEARVTPLTSQSILDRQRPSGSAQRPEGAQTFRSGSASTSKQFSEDSVKELLDSLKRKSSRRNISSSPETSPRDTLGAGEISTLKSRLAEREEAVKKLKSKNSAYKERVEALREKEIELTKALSLSEASQKALKEQEEIASELTNALSEKEKQYAALEVKVYEMKRDCRRLESETERGNKDYEKKILELRRINASLDEESAPVESALSLSVNTEDQTSEESNHLVELGESQIVTDKVKTLRERPMQKSPRHSDEYKKLLEDCLESRAVSASLKDQVQKLEKENQDFKEKLNRQEDLSKYTREPYSSPTGAGLGTSRQEHSITFNGYEDTNGSPTFSRQQYDGLRSPTDTRRQRADAGPYQSYNTRDITSRARDPYDSHRPAFEHIRYQSESTEIRRDRSPPQSEFTRSQCDSQSQTENARSRYEGYRDHSDILQSRSGVYGSEIQTRESRSRRRVTAADDVPSSEISGSSFRHVLPRRSHSSDSVRNRNGFPDGTQSKVSPNQERGNLERVERSGRDRRSKEKSRLTHAGSYDNLNSRYTTTTSSNLTLTGHRIDYSPTSPPSTSPRSERRTSHGKGSPFAPHTPQQIDQGMTVLVSRTRGKLSKGIVRYIGYLPDKGDNVYLGLELHDTDGKHDGKFNEQRFFKCKRDVFSLLVPTCRQVCSKFLDSS